MLWPPSITFLWAASRISNGGTIWPAASASIFRAPAVSLSTRSANSLKLSWLVELAGQVDCILSVRDWAEAGAPAPNAVKARAKAKAPSVIALRARDERRLGVEAAQT